MSSSEERSPFTTLLDRYSKYVLRSHRIDIYGAQVSSLRNTYGVDEQCYFFVGVDYQVLDPTVRLMLAQLFERIDLVQYRRIENLTVL